MAKQSTPTTTTLALLLVALTSSLTSAFIAKSAFSIRQAVPVELLVHKMDSHRKKTTVLDIEMNPEVDDSAVKINGDAPNGSSSSSSSTTKDSTNNVLHETWQKLRRGQTSGPIPSDTLLGGTALIDFSDVLSLNENVKIYAKAEYMNLSGSIKDRIASFMLQAAVDSGELRPGMTVVAATSGNTGCAIAAACTIRGYDHIVITTEKCSEEKINSMKAYGGTVIVAKGGLPANHPEHYQNLEYRMVADDPDKYFGIDQYNNQNNALAYECTLGPEIFVQTNGLLTHFVAGSSTGGTLTGTARYLKSVNPDIKTVLADPRGSVLYDAFVKDIPENQLQVGAWEVEGVGKDSIPGVVSWDVVDGALRVEDSSSFAICRKVSSKLGVLIGGSSGLNLHAASVLSGEIESGVIVTVLPDGGAKYLSKIYNNDWLVQKGLLDQEMTTPEHESIHWKLKDDGFETKLKGIEKLVDTTYSLPNQDRPPADKSKLSSKEQTDTELRFLEDTAAQMVEYYRQSIEIGGKPVVKNQSPSSLRAVFSDAGVPVEFAHEEPSWDQPRLHQAVDTVLQTSVRSSSPLFLNQLYGGVDPVGLAGEWLSATLNANVHTFEVAPALTEIEKSCLAKVSRVWQKTKNNEDDPSHEGLFVPGGSISILYSLLLARHRNDTSIRKTGLRAESKLVAFCSDSSHYSYKKSAIVSGLGEDNLISVKSLSNGAMDPEDLKAKLEQSIENGMTPFYVGLTAGTTVLGAYDPFTELFDVIDSLNLQNDVWTHIDGSWGGGAILSKKHGHLMDGAERSDSFNWNPHKMLGIPLQCSVLVTRHEGLMARAIGTKAEYLFQPDKNNAGADLGDRTLQCGRKADALKLWLAWKLRGDDGFVACVDRSFALAKFVESEVTSSNGRFMLVQPAQCANVCFWYVPPRLRPFNRETATKEDWEEIRKVAPKIKDMMQKAGDAMIGFQPIASMGYVNFFRLVLPSPRHITESDLRSMLDRMDMFGQDL